MQPTGLERQLCMSALHGIEAADARTIAVIVLSYLVGRTVRLASGRTTLHDSSEKSSG